MKLTFPHLGNAYIPVKALLDDLKVNYIVPPFNNKKSLELGTKFSPEMACLPLKINIGNLVQAHSMGADTIFITGGCGPCRFGYYCEMEREILKGMGLEMDTITLEWPDKGLKEFLKRIKRISGEANIFEFFKGVKNTTQIAKMVDDLERLTFKIRPVEVKKGETDAIYRNFQNNVILVKGSKQIKNLINETVKKLNKISIDTNLKPLKVGIVGEIYTTIDSHTNLNIEAKLGSLGVEVDRSVTVSGWIIEHMLKKALSLPRDERYKKEAKPYLGAMIGGHAQETIGNTILYAKDGYDGVIQIFPLTCMPEIVAESILPAVERDFNIPILTLILDEMTGEAGFITRIEAFVDLLNKRREVCGNELLFGN